MVHGLEDLVAINDRTQAEHDKNQKNLRGKIKDTIDFAIGGFYWGNFQKNNEINKLTDKIMEIFNEG